MPRRCFILGDFLHCCTPFRRTSEDSRTLPVLSRKTPTGNTPPQNRASLQSPSDSLRSLPLPLLFLHNVTKIQIRIRKIGLHFNRLPIACDRFLYLSLFLRYIPQIQIRIRKIGLHFNRLPITCDRRLNISLPFKTTPRFTASAKSASLQSPSDKLQSLHPPSTMQ